MPKLELKNISKSFNNTKILENINLSVENGEFMVVVGPSGSGKSTILRIIAGLEKQSSGQVMMDDEIVDDLLPKNRDIAMVFQNYALYPHMSVFENLAFPLRMSKSPKNHISDSVSEVAELLNIKSHLFKKPKDLSGGERQRVALGRAIIRKPKLFLMDEPLSNLDAKLRVQMRSELLKLHNALSSTIVYVTHDQIEALTMGTRILVLNQGSIQQIDTPENIYKFPNNVFVAGFVGSPAMNFFDIKILGEKRILFLENTIEFSFSLPVKLLKYQNQDLLLGIRAEHLKTCKQGDIVFTAGIDFVEVLGDERLIYVSLPNSKKSAFSIKQYEDFKLRTNDTVDVSIDLSNAHYFKKLSGERI